MSEWFTIEVSSEVAQKLRRIAKFMEISVESLIVKILERDFFMIELVDIQAESIPRYSAAQLWTIVEKIRVSADKKYIILCTQVLARLRELGYDVDAYIQENELETFFDS